MQHKLSQDLTIPMYKQAAMIDINYSKKYLIKKCLKHDNKIYITAFQNNYRQNCSII